MPHSCVNGSFSGAQALDAVRIGSDPGDVGAKPATTAFNAGDLDCSASPLLASAPSQAAKPGTGERVQNTLSRGNSRDTTSTTFLMRKLPSDTPRRPGWQLLIE